MKKIELQIQEKKKIVVYINKLENLLKVFNQEIFKYTKILLITHKNLWVLYQDRFKDIKLKTLFLPEGEKIKSFQYFKFLCEKFLELKIDRKSLVLIFGGGVLGDLVGFVCSTYMRGISYVQIPTTLLAMIDSSIGGKTAINLSKGKNLVGSFYQPKIIFCDTSLLKTLPKQEIYNGLGEILKYAIINKKVYRLLNTKDNFLLSGFNSKFFKDVVFECIKTKFEIVKKDEKEITGLREQLNLGHTIAHAIEVSTKYKVYSHGEAVILGLVAESFLSYKLNILPKNELDKIILLINKYVKDKEFDKALLKVSIEKVFSFIKFDKKVYQKNLRFALPVSIGKVKTIDNISKDSIFQSITFLKQWIKER